MSSIFDLKNPRIHEIDNTFPLRGWLHVFARPDVYQQLTRQPTREHLLRLVDAYMPFARSRRERANEQGYISGAEEPLAEELADRMRALLEAWSPPDLPEEIVSTARALLQADRSYRDLDWDKGPDLDPGQSVEDILVWPPWDPMPA